MVAAKRTTLIAGDTTADWMLLRPRAYGPADQSRHRLRWMHALVSRSGLGNKPRVDSLSPSPQEQHDLHVDGRSSGGLTRREA
jgi:hypothetical protein